MPNWRNGGLFTDPVSGMAVLCSLFWRLKGDSLGAVLCGYVISARGEVRTGAKQKRKTVAYIAPM